MCEIEVKTESIDSETDDFSDSYEESSGTDDSEEMKERVGSYMEKLEGASAAKMSKVAGEKMDNALKGMDEQLNNTRGLRELHKYENGFNSKIEVRESESPADLVLERRGMELVRDAVSANEGVVNGKPIIFLRLKFWALFLGITSTMIAGALGYWLSKIDGTPPSELPDLPEEAKKAIDQRIKLWKDLSFDEFFQKLHDFITVWSMTPKSQGYVVNQLMAVTPQPSGLAGMTYEQVAIYVDQLLAHYHAAVAPKSLSLYSFVKTFTRVDEKEPEKVRKLSKHEGLYIISVALAQINAFDGSEN